MKLHKPMWGLIFLSGLSMADTTSYVAETCGGCHALQEVSKDVDERINRKGSHLYYAGNKYQYEWLEAWLQAPTQIRPGGDYPLNHTLVTEDGDVIEADSLLEHMILDSDQAIKVTDYLMTLTPFNELLEQVEYEPKAISQSAGEMNFVKFQGCQSCHRDDPEYGGVSGPELYTAWNRLQQNYIISYTQNPELWDKNTMMPNRHIKNSALEKVANYLKVIGESHE
jgi:mono/diheme cytochrome c family protein|tara:strand:+ start:2335 stop:3009 length:675 start_codon:yes stop_codon:yes gene_type:complete